MVMEFMWRWSLCGGGVHARSCGDGVRVVMEVMW